MSTLSEYREAYRQAVQVDPEIVRGLPDPNNAATASFDPARALEELRRLTARLTTDPRTDLKA